MQANANRRQGHIDAERESETFSWVCSSSSDISTEFCRSSMDSTWKVYSMLIDIFVGYCVSSAEQFLSYEVLWK